MPPFLAKGKIVHTKIRPALIKPVPFDTSSSASNVELPGFFQRSIEATVEYVDAAGQRLSKIKECILFQMTNADTGNAKRGMGNSFLSENRHGFVLQVLKPTENLSFHYTFFGNEMSVRSVVRSQQLRHPGLEQLLQTNLSANCSFPGFEHESSTVSVASNNLAVDTLENLIGEKLLSCSRSSSSFSVKLQVCTANRAMIATFRELVGEHRKVEHFHVELVQTPYSLVQRDVRARLARYRAAHLELRTSLSQLLEVALDSCPTAILKTDGVFPGAKFAASHANYASENNPASKEKLELEYMVKLLSAFCTSKDVRVEVVAVKSFPVFLKYPELQCSKAETLVLTLYRRVTDSEPEPLSYFATLHAPDDMFFHFTSADITQKIWKNLLAVYLKDSHKIGPVTVSQYRSVEIGDGVQHETATSSDYTTSGLSHPSLGVSEILLNNLVAQATGKQNGRIKAELSIDFPSAFRQNADVSSFVELPVIAPPLDYTPAGIGIASDALADYRRSVFKIMHSRQVAARSSLAGKRSGGPTVSSLCEVASLSTITKTIDSLSLEAERLDPPKFEATLEFTEDIGIRCFKTFRLDFSSTDSNVVQGLVTTELKQSAERQVAVQDTLNNLLANLKKLAPIEYSQVVQNVPNKVSDSAGQRRLHAVLGGHAINTVPVNVKQNAHLVKTNCNVVINLRRNDTCSKSSKYADGSRRRALRKGPFDDSALCSNSSARSSKGAQSSLDSKSWFFQHLA